MNKQKENPARCAGEGRQSKGNIEEEKIDSAIFDFYNETMKIMCEGKSEEGVGGRGGMEEGEGWGKGRQKERMG